MTEQGPIYLDQAATTRPLPEVIEAMAKAQYDLFGNPSSKHAFGPPARKALDDAREFLRGTLGAARVVFTSGGSEADYLGIVGSAAERSPGRVLMSASDHPAILATAGLLSRWRHHTTVMPVSDYGDVEPESMFDVLGRDVRVVALQHGHNELGTLSDLQELVSVIRHSCPEAHVHVDLVQTYGKLPFDLDATGVDSVAVSAHKFHGPRGVGMLAMSSTAKVAPLQLAGGQEGGLRGGTENVAGAVGMMVAAEHALSRQHATELQLRRMTDLVEDAIAAAFDDYERLGHPRHRLPHILSLRIPGVVGETLMTRCSARGLAFSTGAACHGIEKGQQPEGPKGNRPDNHVLDAIGLSAREAREVLRISFGSDNTEQEALAAANILVEEARQLRAMAPRA
jgi:cysteine desulfurase